MAQPIFSFSNKEFNNNNYMSFIITINSLSFINKELNNYDCNFFSVMCNYSITRLLIPRLPVTRWVKLSLNFELLVPK